MYRLIIITGILSGSVSIGSSGVVLAGSSQNKTKWPECFCTDREGQRRELGDIICLTVGDRSYMAKCVMALNNPFWRDLRQGCLSSSLPSQQSVVASLDTFIDKAK